MSEIVFILGAGTSAEAGAPVTRDFLGAAENLRRERKVTAFAADFDLVDTVIGELQRLLPKTYVNLNDIETVFGLFEMGQLLGSFLERSEEEIKQLLISIKRVIVETLERTLLFPVAEGTVRPAPYHEAFATLIHRLHIKDRRTCSVVTFNYDLALDFALYHNAQIPFDYCLSDQVKGSHVRLIKLHGSLNWGGCSKCGAVLPWQLGDFFARVRRTRANQKMALNVGSSLPQWGLKHCGEEIEHTPVIVPPTWNKTRYSDRLGQVWRHAATELANAEYVFVSGYALNPVDSFFPHLFALGLSGSTQRVRLFQVFDIDGDVERRFKALVGPGVGAFSFSQSQFSLAIPLIAHALRLPEEMVKQLMQLCSPSSARNSRGFF